RQHEPPPAEAIRIERVLGLKYPCVVSQSVYYDDFGSHGIELRGARGTRFMFCFRGGSVMPKDPADQSWRAPRPMYVGALHPDGPGAHPVAIGGVEEAAVRDALRLYVDRALPAIR